MKTSIIILSILFSSNVFAKALPIKWDAPVIPIQEMTCEEAQAYAAEYGHYWKQVNPKDIVPIYPINLDSAANCKGGHSKSKLKSKKFEKVLDGEKCLMTWYCD